MRSELNYDRSNIRTKVKSIIGRNFSGIDDVINEGDIVKVKVLDVDGRGKVKLSMKEAEAE